MGCSTEDSYLLLVACFSSFFWMKERSPSLFHFNDMDFRVFFKVVYENTKIHIFLRLFINLAYLVVFSCWTGLESRVQGWRA